MTALTLNPNAASAANYQAQLAELATRLKAEQDRKDQQAAQAALASVNKSPCAGAAPAACPSSSACAPSAGASSCAGGAMTPEQKAELYRKLMLQSVCNCGQCPSCQAAQAAAQQPAAMSVRM